MNIRIFCDECERYVPFSIDLRKDVFNAKPWADIICPLCGDMITTLEGSEAGKYKIVKEIINERTKGQSNNGN